MLASWRAGDDSRHDRMSADLIEDSKWRDNVLHREAAELRAKGANRARRSSPTSPGRPQQGSLGSGAELKAVSPNGTLAALRGGRCVPMALHKGRD